jgi:hypothetical protein
MEDAEWLGERCVWRRTDLLKLLDCGAPRSALKLGPQQLQLAIIP